jgi:hypothetical protein
VPRRVDRDGSVPDLRHVTTLRVKSLFTRPSGASPRFRGPVGLRVDFDVNGPLQPLPTTTFSRPDRSQLRHLRKRYSTSEALQNFSERNGLYYK